MFAVEHPSGTSRLDDLNEPAEVLGVDLRVPYVARGLREAGEGPLVGFHSVQDIRDMSASLHLDPELTEQAGERLVPSGKLRLPRGYLQHAIFTDAAPGLPGERREKRVPHR